MIGILIRILIVVIGSLVSVTWFPSSFLPLWLTMAAANFFSLREGTILFVGFSLTSLAINPTWYQIFVPLVLWIGLLVIIIPGLLPHGKRLSWISFILAGTVLSLILQLIAYTGHYQPAFWLIFGAIFSHAILLLIITLPAKILGEAYARYLNALGIYHE
ncbi:hypothetical protein KBB08_02025 [Candidatus Gracilibacteria bacterium]|nr:hypothetical protein [Candidatus Gracilibacteria bacterium]